jgi:hypothetical protein
VLRLIKLSQYKLNFKQTIKIDVFKTNAKKWKFSGNNTRRGNCIMRSELLKRVEDSNALFRVVMTEKIDSNNYQHTEYSDRELKLHFSVYLAKGQNTLRIRL